MDIKIKQELHEEVTCEENAGALMDASVSNGAVKLEYKLKKELREEFTNEIDDNTEYLCELCNSYFPNLSSLQDQMQNNNKCDEKIDVKSPKNSVNFDAMQNTEVKEASVEVNYTEKVEIEMEEKCKEMKTKRKRQRLKEKDDRIDSEKDEYENDKSELVNLIMKDHIILRKKNHDGIFDMESFKIVKKEETEGINENDNGELVNLVMKDHIILRINNHAEKIIAIKTEASEETSRDSMCEKSNVHAKTSDGHNQINNELCETTHDTTINVISDACDESNSRKRDVSCDVCKKKFTRRGHLARHVKRFHLKTNETENTPSPNQKHVCTICDKSYETRKKFKRHFYKTHKSPVFCDFCTEKFSRGDSLARHVKRFHWKTNETENTPSPNQKHVCTLCDKSYETREKLKSHFSNTHKSPVFCDVCSKKFSRKDNLERHMKVVHLRIEETENHVCTLCDKSYENGEKLKIHFYNTHKSPVFCDVCSKKFSRKGHLETHMKRVHLRKNVYKCKFCEKKYFDKNVLNRHTRIYCTKKKPITCKLCTNKYASQKKFETHIADHPRFICDYCDKVFYLKRSIFIHIKRIHLKVRHRCKKCGSRYDFLYLKKHMKLCKGNIE